MNILLMKTRSGSKIHCLPRIAAMCLTCCAMLYALPLIGDFRGAEPRTTRIIFGDILGEAFFWFLSTHSHQSGRAGAKKTKAYDSGMLLRSADAPYELCEHKRNVNVSA